jgi:hypothetical protein
MFLNPMPVLAIPEFVHQHLHWFAFGAIILIGLIIFGMRDLLRFSWTRVWAISGVCFDESIRRRVLWITPLAILGVIVVSQLQKPFDEQDAIRQTIKFCLFATGLIVAITTVILACTNLPREIDNRVIYTVVTKPTTRLEIVLGKVVGFARVSALILLIMGIFTTAYLRVRAWSMERYIGERLQVEAVPQGMKATLAHYREEGLLTARALATPQQLQVMGRLPDKQGRRWMVGEGEGDMLVPFPLPPNVLGAPGNPEVPPGAAGVLIAARIGFEQDAQTPKNPPKPVAARDAEEAAKNAPTTGANAAAEPYPYMVPFIVPPEERATVATLDRPTVAFNVLSPALTSIGQAKAIVGGMLTDASGIELADPTGQSMILALIPPQVAGEMSKYDRCYIQVTCGTPKTRLFIEQQPMILQVPGATREQQMTPIMPVKDPEAADQTLVVFRGRQGTYGSQIRGDTDLNKAPIAVYSFRNADLGNAASDDASGGVPFELRTGIERSGDYDESSDAPTNVQVIVRNIKSGQESEKIHITPESGRPTFFKIPSSLLADGNFDVQLQNYTQGHYAGLQQTSLSLIRERQMFEANLFKSLLILWLMSVLVTSVCHLHEHVPVLADRGRA